MRDTILFLMGLNAGVGAALVSHDQTPWLNLAVAAAGMVWLYCEAVRV